MVKKIRWTPEAVDSFNRVIKYLLDEWSEHEVENFVFATDKVIEYISHHPKMFRKTNRKNIREALVTPQNLLIYKITSTPIDILVFGIHASIPAKRNGKFFYPSCFRKNNVGKDVMIDSPSVISEEQLKELGIKGV